jgi:hypothetical protein
MIWRRKMEPAEGVIKFPRALPDTSTTYNRFASTIKDWNPPPPVKTKKNTNNKNSPSITETLSSTETNPVRKGGNAKSDRASEPEISRPFYEVAKRALCSKGIGICIDLMVCTLMQIFCMMQYIG